MSASFTAICDEIMKSVPGALSCSVVDLGSGTVLASNTAESNRGERTLIELALATLGSAQLTALRQRLGSPASERADEVTFALPQRTCFVRFMPGSDVALVLGAVKGANPGMAWYRLRHAAEELTRSA